jgi:hypothetical protein
MRRSVCLGLALVCSSLFLAACDEDVIVRNACSSTLTDVKVDDKSIGDLTAGQEADAEVGKHGKTPITWKYNGESQSDQISGTGAYSGAVYELGCWSGDWQ